MCLHDVLKVGSRYWLGLLCHLVQYHQDLWQVQEVRPSIKLCLNRVI